MYRKLTVGLLASGLIAGGVASGPASASGLAGQPVEVRGSFQTSDGVPYKHVRWAAQAADGTIGDSGITDEDGNFTVLTSPASDTEVVFRGLEAGNVPEPWDLPPSFESGTYDSLFCADSDWSGDVNLKSVPLVIPQGQGRLDIRTQPAHRVAVLVTDKFGELVRNATVNPNSYAESSWSNQRDKDWSSHNYQACNAPNQWFTGTSGVDATLRLGGWVPGLTGGTTDSSGRAFIATPGPIDPSADFAVVRAAIRPGATQMTRVAASSIEGNDPLNRVSVGVLPYAPIMEDASIAGVIPGEATPRMRAMSTNVTPTVIVRQPNGTALPNTEVQVVPVLAGDTEVAPAEGPTVATATTGADGKATFNDLGNGTYRAIPVNVSARTVDFTVSGAGDTQPPVAQPPVAQPPVVEPPVAQPPVAQPPVAQPPVAQPPVAQPPVAEPPVSSRPAATVKVKAVQKKSKLRVDVNPNKGRGFWKFKVQKQRASGSWKSLKTYKTKGKKEIRTINLKRGTYRVVVRSKYGYDGTTSESVYLKR